MYNGPAVEKRKPGMRNYRPGSGWRVEGGVNLANEVTYLLPRDPGYRFYITVPNLFSRGY